MFSALISVPQDSSRFKIYLILFFSLFILMPRPVFVRFFPASDIFFFGLHLLIIKAHFDFLLWCFSFGSYLLRFYSKCSPTLSPLKTHLEYVVVSISADYICLLLLCCYYVVVWDFWVSNLSKRWSLTTWEQGSTNNYLHAGLLTAPSTTVFTSCNKQIRHKILCR